MLHCIHFALSSPILLEGGAQEGSTSSVSSRVDEPASHEQQAKTHTDQVGKTYLGGVRAPLPGSCSR